MNLANMIFHSESRFFAVILSGPAHPGDFGGRYGQSRPAHHDGGPLFLTQQKDQTMNRRKFSAASLATVFAPLPQPALARRPAPALPGYQIAEISDGVLTTGFGGMATARSLVHGETLFQVASCSKTVTALAILTLVRDGVVALDQPASRYLRRWQMPGPRSTTTTIAELLSHTAGTTVHGFDGYGPDEALPGLLDVLNGQHPANSDAIRTRRILMRHFRYSGGGTMVLHALIEDVTGEGFSDYVTSQVLIPIGAPHASFAIRPDAALAHGQYENAQWVEGGFRRHPESAAAGLWATAADLARIMQAVVQSLRGAEDALLPVDLAQRMVTPMAWRAGLGVFVNPGAIISHDGRNHGFDSIMTADLNTGDIRTAVTNRNGAIESLVQKLVSL
ncbi:MAG: serine hydrolase domain-containing protein [Pikeienuella sp.]